MMRKKIKPWQPTVKALLLKFWIAGTLLFLTACITTTNAPEPKIDLKKAEETHVQAGLGYLRQNDKESARRHFIKAIEIDPRSAGAHNGLALVYQFEEDPDRAEQHFLLALSSQPEFSLARNNFAAFLFKHQRYEDAEKHLLKVTQDYTYDRRDIALMNLGRTQAQLGKTDEAIKSLKQALGINFRLPLPHLELAEIYFQRQEHALAKKHLDQFGKLSRHTARSLWLGIRIERHFGNKNKLASYELALKNLHQYSDEYIQYKKSIE